MNYSETLEYLFTQLPMYQRTGQAAYKADLSNTIKICTLLGNPENKFKSIHIAGTNGKGSTSHFIASILQESGYKVGLYTSPHLVDFRERIKINGEMIYEDYVVDFVQRNLKIFDEVQPSFFEWTVGLAFEYFAQKKVDIAVIETGLGGRLDSTNVITPLLSVITNIGLDHTQFLGNTLQLVAREKAGIIKLEIPVIIGETQEEVSHVFLDKARESNSKILFADQQSKILDVSDFVNYQQKNIQTATQAILLLSPYNFEITSDNIRKGIYNMTGNTGLRGRWEILQQNPLVVADTAHNKEGLTYTMQQIKRQSFNNLRIVFGMVNDKSPQGILELLPKDAQYYLCQPSIQRAMEVEELKEFFDSNAFKSKVFSSVKEALNAAVTDSQADDIVYVGGSTFVVADAL